MIKLQLINVFYKYLQWRPQAYNKFKEYEKKSNFKIFKVMQSTSKTNLTITFWAILLMTSFKYLTLIFSPNTTIKGAKTSNLNNTLLLLLGVWTKKIGFSIGEHFFSYTWPWLLPLGFNFHHSPDSYLFLHQ